jgi:hypothetical protein
MLFLNIIAILKLMLNFVSFSQCYIILHFFILDVLEFFHKSFFNNYKLFVKLKENVDFSRHWIHECGMDATRFPSLALHFKAVLKTGSGGRVWETQGFSCGLQIYFEILILTFQK